MPLNTGMRLGPYEIVAQLGRGGMGEVYRAKDTRLGRDVAVKVISGDDDVTPAQLSRFEDEARAIASLNHPNILALHDVGNAAGVVYAVMELLEGEDLRNCLGRESKLPAPKALNIAIQVARGLAAAHERGFIHRDLKPENVFITQDGRVKILDFGLAQQEAETDVTADTDTRETRFTTGPGIVVGTPGYISPEQMLGRPATSRSDLFAFGIVVYEMLMGAHPFERPSATDTAAAILRDDPPALGPRISGVPAPIVTLLEQCLEKQASDRPGSARDLAIYLEAFSGASNTPAAPAVSPADVRVLRTRVLAIACGLIVLFALVPWIVARAARGRAVSAAIDADLAGAEQVARRVQRDRFGALSLTARLIASFPELKALFATDAATVRDYLLSYQQRNPGVPLLVALGPDGKAFARTDSPTPIAGDDEWIGALLGGRGEPLVVSIGGRPHHAAAAAVEAGGNFFGTIVCASPVDTEFASSLREATQDEVLLLSDSALLASTLRTPPPWRTRTEWRQGGGGPDRTATVTVGVQDFAAREVPLVEKPAVSAVVLKSRDEAIEPFARVENSLALVGLLGLAAAAAAAWLIARTLAATLQRR